jgi:integrase
VTALWITSAGMNNTSAAVAATAAVVRRVEVARRSSPSLSGRPPAPRRPCPRHRPAGAAHRTAIDLAIGERSEGPVFRRGDGQRLDRHGAGRIVRRVARRAGIAKPVGPHTLRHAFITAALDAGVSLRDVQEAASHADPRTTMRYDRARGSLDRHATYIVAAYVAGAAR